MDFIFSDLDDFMALCTSFSTYMRLFYFTNGTLYAYGLPATTKHLMVVTDDSAQAATTALTTAFPGAIQLQQPLDLGEEQITANCWADFHTLMDGIADPLQPQTVTYYIDNGNFHIIALDPPTGLTITAEDLSHTPGREAEILAAFPSALKFNHPVSILEVE